MPTFSERELATMLAALRAWQRVLIDQAQTESLWPDHFREGLTH
jgi:hypothetical protein